MKLSDKTKSQLYEAMKEPLMQRRIEIAQSTDIFDEKTRKILDERLSRTEREIWKGIEKALNLSD